MRIRDWSSDVCSADLLRYPENRRARGQRRAAEGPRHRDGVPELRAVPAHDGGREPRLRTEVARPRQGLDRRARGRGGEDPGTGPAARPQARRRSEEHTSELQSLMRISYAVLCLTKKTNTTN